MRDNRELILDSLESQNLKIGDRFSENEDSQEDVILEYVSEYEDDVRQVLGVRSGDGHFSVVHSVEDKDVRIDVTQWFLQDADETAEKVADETELLSKSD